MTNRRDVIARAAWILGSAMSPRLANALLLRAEATTSTDQKERALRSLNDSQNAFVSAICEVIIPDTDTPGASEAKVNEFIDMMLSDWYPKSDRTYFLLGIDELDERCVAKYVRPFLKLDPQEQYSFVDMLDAEAIDARKTGVDPLPVFGMIKELALVGYYTSEVGMTIELQSIGPVAVSDFGSSGPPANLTRY